MLKGTAWIQHGNQVRDETDRSSQFAEKDAPSLPPQVRTLVLFSSPAGMEAPGFHVHYCEHIAGFFNN
jgi:hypothetical protein